MARQAVSLERWALGAALALLTALCWAEMLDMGGEGGAPERWMPCCGAHFGMTLAMWLVMMAGMMIPSAAPMVLRFAAMARARSSRRSFVVSTLAVLGGYLAAWSAFAAAAALAQWWLFRRVLLDPRTLSVSPLAGGALLVAAGAFQLSPMKRRCLAHCRSPLADSIAEGGGALVSALRAGFEHGVFCVGCCWLLMAVLFAVGVMNVLWGAVLTGFVLAERVLPWRRAVVWFGAGACGAAGVGLMARAVLGG